MRRIVLGLVVLSLAAPAAAFADGPITVPSVEAPKEKKICRRVVDTGTLAGNRRVCMTESERQAQIKAAQDQTRDFQAVQPGAGGPH